MSRSSLRNQTSPNWQIANWPVLRVALPAGGLWAVLFGTGTISPPRSMLVWQLCGAMVALVACLWTVWVARGWVLVAALVGTGAALGAVVGAGQVLRTVPEGLAAPIAAGATVVAEVRISTDPLPIAAGSAGTDWRASAIALTMTARGKSYAGRIPVMLIGPAVADLRYGGMVRVVGRLTHPRRAGEVTAVIRVAGDPVPLRAPGRVAQATTAVRASLGAAVTGLPPDSAALLLGLAIGDESRVSPDLKEAMVRAGLAHLTAVSGSNTTLVMGLAIAVIARLGFGWRIRVWGAGLVLMAFVAVVRPQPSVLRAAAMGVVTLLVLSRGGHRDGRRALAGAVFVLLVANPGLASSVGFALSVAATAGLLTMAERLRSSSGATPLGSWLPPPILAGIAVTVAATAATLPLTVGLGNGLSLISLPANLVVVPLVPVVTVAGLAAALIGLINPGLASLIAALVGPLAGAIGSVARTLAGMPGGVVPIAGGWIPGLTTLAVLGIGVLVHAHRGWRTMRRVFHAGTLTLLLGWIATSCLPGPLRSAWPPADWTMASCDVGQGDATLIRIPGPGPPKAVLVDAGPDPGALRRCLGALNVAGLGAVFLTHPHADHIDGLPAIPQVWPDQWADIPLITSTTGSRLPSALIDGHPPAIQARAGGQFGVGGLRIDVLWPAREVVESPVNNSSLVLLVTVPPVARAATGLRVLITGDIETEAQLAVMARSAAPAADVLKVAHHGSPRQAPGFAAWSGARIALVSVGADNDYGHPAAATISQLTASGLLVGRTDRQGGLSVVRREALGLVNEK